MKTVVLVSPHFPPSALAGVHRARHLAKHLPAHGWQPVVVRVSPEHYTEPNDPGIGALVPDTVEQIHTGALPARLTRAVGIGDVSLRAYRQIARATAQAVTTRRADAVFITAAPYYTLLMTRRLSRDLGVPVVVDLQDPWVSAYGASRPPFSKEGLAHRLARFLEPRALRHAAYVTSVSTIQNEELAARYSFLSDRAMAAIPIGGDPEDFERLRAAPPADPIHPLDPAYVNLSYVGTIWPRAEKTLRVVFRAVQALFEQEPGLSGRLRLNFVGTSAHSGEGAPERVAPIASEMNLGDVVVETARRVPYLEALSLQSRSDGLLLLGSDEPHYTASKIYAALMSGRPYVSLFHERSSAHAVLSAAGGGCALSFGSAADLDRVTKPLAEALRTLATAPQTFGSADPRAYADFTASSVARRYGEIFDEICAGEAPRRSFAHGAS